jgi:hypothetical protein
VPELVIKEFREGAGAFFSRIFFLVGHMAAEESGDYE